MHIWLVLRCLVYVSLLAAKPVSSVPDHGSVCDEWGRVQDLSGDAGLPYEEPFTQSAFY